MSQKMEFVARASKAGANVADLCRQYGVSRETGHKWLRRFREQGLDGLNELSRRPARAPNATSETLVLAVLDAREAHPMWGPKKLQQLLQRKYGKQTPSRATIARLLERFGRVRRKQVKRVSVVEQAPSVLVNKPNALWTVDFKGWWKTSDGSRCEPLTIRDAFSRYVLLAKAMPSTRAALVREHFEALFARYGLPTVIQCDNGSPFICTEARGGLTRLSAWWVSLGIAVVRSRLGCPQDNGGHERMHRDLSEQVEANPEDTLRREQRAIDRWRQEFNHVRPHEALRGKVPADLYKPSTRRSMQAVRFVYPSSWLVRRADVDGKIYVSSIRYRVSKSLAGYNIAIEPLGGFRHRLWFHDIDLGEIELTPSGDEVEAILKRPTPAISANRVFRDRSGPNKKRSEQRARKRPARRGSNGPRAGQARC